jgi:hypothetical protein
MQSFENLSAVKYEKNLRVFRYGIADKWHCILLIHSDFTQFNTKEVHRRESGLPYPVQKSLTHLVNQTQKPLCHPLQNPFLQTYLIMTFEAQAVQVFTWKRGSPEMSSLPGANSFADPH